MMKAKDYRKEAWGKLGGKWGTMALCTLIVTIIGGVCAGLSFFVVGAFASLLITGPLAAGTALLAVSVIRGNNVSVEMQFSGFKNFVKTFLLNLINGIFIFLWSLLFFIPGIIKTFSYSMSYYVLLDNPSMSSNDARKRSMEIMAGNKWRLFCLEFSFIGWGILCLLTLGILSFWVSPYMESAKAAFYQSLVKKDDAEKPDAAEPEVKPEESEATAE